MLSLRRREPMDPPDRGQRMSTGCCWTSKFEVFELFVSISLGSGSTERGNDLSLVLVARCWMRSVNGKPSGFITVVFSGLKRFCWGVCIHHCPEEELCGRPSTRSGLLVPWLSSNQFQVSGGIARRHRTERWGLLPILYAWLIITCTTVTFGGFFPEQ